MTDRRIVEGLPFGGVGGSGCRLLAAKYALRYSCSDISSSQMAVILENMASTPLRTSEVPLTHQRCAFFPYHSNAFAHLLSFLHIRSFDLIMNIRYPPYTKRKLSWFQMLLNPTMPPRPRQLAPPAPGSKSGSWFSNWMYVIFGRDGSLFNFFVYVKRLISRGRW